MGRFKSSDSAVFFPKLITALQHYSWPQFFQDMLAGVVVGVVALPLAIAFGIASGLTPQAGLVTAVIAGFLISFLGGSRVQIGGPTGAFIVIVLEIVTRFGHSGLMIATIMAGVMLILMGLFRFGALLKFVPEPVIIGFTSGIALIIFTTQIPDLLGLTLASVPESFAGKWMAYGQALGSINLNSVLVSFGTIITYVVLMKRFPRLPNMFLSLVIWTILPQLFSLSVETIGTNFAAFGGSFPLPAVPAVSLANVRELISPALSIALLGAIESLLSATVADGAIGGRHRPNTELIAQGVANLAAPVFGGMPATGAIARTITNVRAGGRTPVAGMVHAVVLLVLFLLLGDVARLIPMPVLAGILTIVAYNMSEWREFKSSLSGPRADVLVLLATFFLTVLVDLSVGIQVGVVLSAFLFLERMASVSTLKEIQQIKNENQRIDEHYFDKTSLHALDIPKDVILYEVQGAFFFGAATKFERLLTPSWAGVKAIVLYMKYVMALDSSGLRVLHRLHKVLKARGVRLYFAELSPHCREALMKSHLIKEIGQDAIIPQLTNENLRLMIGAT